ncbi:helix-turn-helix domain-containing protein [Streptococcus cameli]
MFELYKKIEELAKKRGVSLQKVAIDLGLSENYIYNLKNKKTANMEPIEKIADYFNVSMDYLTGRTDNPRIAKESDAPSEVDLKELAKESFFYDGHHLNDEDIDLIASLLETRIKNRQD